MLLVDITYPTTAHTSIITSHLSAVSTTALTTRQLGPPHESPNSHNYFNPKPISEITEPISDMFVLISMHFS